MSNAGRPKAFESPEELYSYFKKYKEKVKSSPFLVHDFVGKDADEVFRAKEKPLTMEGFECYLFEEGVINDLGDYLSNKNGAYSEFSTICRAIQKEIRRDQIEGGLAGLYNPSITQRLNGLVEKSEQKVIQEMPIFGDNDNE